MTTATEVRRPGEREAGTSQPCTGALLGKGVPARVRVSPTARQGIPRAMSEQWWALADLWNKALVAMALLSGEDL